MPEEDQEMIEEDDVDYDALDNDENFEYKLVGVVLHHGTADFGHYISIANVERGTKDSSSPDWYDTGKDRWLLFNDKRVSLYK
jgi:ubiquitin C-terminal hydrolase